MWGCHKATNCDWIVKCVHLKNFMVKNYIVVHPLLVGKTSSDMKHSNYGMGAIS